LDKAALTTVNAERIARREQARKSIPLEFCTCAAVTIRRNG
jgi:hypothetical protein